jgi:hypothetical protein
LTCVVNVPLTAEVLSSEFVSVVKSCLTESGSFLMTVHLTPVKRMLHDWPDSSAKTLTVHFIT